MNPHRMLIVGGLILSSHLHALAETQAAEQASAIPPQVEMRPRESGNAYEAAFAPLVALLAPPPAVAPAVPAVSAVAKPAPVPDVPAPLHAAPPHHAVRATASPASATPRQNQPRVGILGNRNTYAAELERDFPGIDFTCIDTAKKIDSVKDCDKVVSMVKWISHAADRRARKAADARYAPVEGGLTDLKRMLSLWLVSGELRTK